MAQSQSATNWCNTHTHVDCTHSLTHSHQHSYNHTVRSATSANTEFGIKLLFFKVPERGGANYSLPANQYYN